MEDHSLDFDPQLKGLSIHDWSNRIHEIAEQFGSVTPLGDAHTAYFLKAGPKLLVTFESAERIRGSRLAAEPRGFLYAREEGWSCLTIVSEHLSWFREPAIYEYFDSKSYFRSNSSLAAQNVLMLILGGTRVDALR